MEAGERLTFTTSLIGAGSNPVPVMVTGVPGIPLVGLKFVIVGAPVPLVTVKGDELVAIPEGAVTVTAPVVAPLGTVTVSWVALADVTVAAVPLNVTVFWLVVAPKPVPVIVTAVPIGPLVGDSSMIVVCDDGWRLIERRFPTASY
jgi:hypothetical protein